MKNEQIFNKILRESDDFNAHASKITNAIIDQYEESLSEDDYELIAERVQNYVANYKEDPFIDLEDGTEINIEDFWEAGF